VDKPGRMIRHPGSTRGLWAIVKPAARNIASEPLPSPNLRYCAVADALFPGIWLAQPLNYEGRGFVYVFRGPDAELEAKAFVNDKNRKGGIHAAGDDFT
jgi:hypothetical protein